jgi:hypothetical protein
VDTNAVADEVLVYLETKHTRVYRNKRPRTPVFPYIVFRVESVINSMPSEDFYINVDIFEDVSESVRAMESLADAVDNNLNHSVIDTEKLNMHFEREIRQYIQDEELVGMHMINLRYNTRIYFKGEI